MENFILLFKLRSVIVARVCTFVIVRSAWIAFTVVSMTTLLWLNVLVKKRTVDVMLVM